MALSTSGRNKNREVEGCNIKQDFDTNRRRLLSALSTSALGVISNFFLWPTSPSAAGNPLQGYDSVLVEGAVEYRMRANQIPYVVRQLARKGRNSDWLVFMFRTSEVSPVTDDQIPNLQFSLAENVIGLEWVLLGERNIADCRRIAALAESRHKDVMRQTINDVPLLRIEGKDLIELACAIVNDLYGLDAESEIGLLVSGFKI